VVLVGDIALVGAPAELFTQLGLDIKSQPPFRHTSVVGLANDWIGCLPDQAAHKLAGYQVWAGYHSYAELVSGERLVDQAVTMLAPLAAACEQGL
jgi:hypothetical protein